MIRKATISQCGKYRYELTRTWDKELPKVMFIMLNPSKADGEEDDTTIRRCINYAKDWGYGSLVVCNLFAYRATDPDDLKAFGKKHGVQLMVEGTEDTNQIYIDENAVEADKVILAWGIRGNMFGGRDQLLINYLRTLRVKMYYLELSSIWEMPCHPLMLKKNLKPKRYRPWKK